VRTALSWMKSNPISVLSAIVAVASIAVIVTFVMKDSQVKKDLAARKSTHGKVSSLLRSSITVANPQPETYSVTVNPAVVEQAKQLNETYAEQVEALESVVPSQNAEDHEVVLEGVLPKWDEASDVFAFAETYREKLIGMLGSSPSPDGLPRLNAGSPRAMAEIELEVKVFADSYFGDESSSSGSSRTTRRNAAEQAAMQDELDEESKKFVRELMANQAFQIKVYAQPDPLLPSFSLEMAPWAYAQELPEAWELFEGQLGFWFQQDLLKAISLANADEDNVLTTPVKRLVSVELDQGYAGFHTAGLVPKTPVVALAGAASVGSSSNSAIATISERGLVFASERRNVSMDPSRRSTSVMPAYAPPPTGFASEVTGTLSDNFHVGITGRISNPLYVVRHAKLVLVLDSKTGVSKFTEAINSVNRMAVISMRFQNEDEYTAVQEGYVYGKNDVIRAEVVVESLWFTEWMQPYMPDRVKHYLGLEEHEEFNSEGMDEMMDMFGGDFGF